MTKRCIYFVNHFAVSAIKTCMFFLFVLCSYRGMAVGQTNYGRFFNVNLETEAAAVCCVLHDEQGMAWLGTDKGVYSYDGYNTRACFGYGTSANSRIYCGVVAAGGHLYWGADSGLLIYNTRTDSYEQVSVTFPKDIRAMKVCGNRLWLGTLHGLYSYDTETHKLDTLAHRLPHASVYSLLATGDDHLYIGTYNGLCRYNVRLDKLDVVSLPATLHHNNQFVNALLLDSVRQSIWIGMEGALLKLPLAGGPVVPVEPHAMEDNSVKSLVLDAQGRLLAGTDNGLYIYHERQPLVHVVHDARDAYSLANNIVWNLTRDAAHNIWIGTDNGLSVSAATSRLHYVSIAQITRSGEGNQFYQIYRSSRYGFWLGGTNGLLRVQPSGAHAAAAWDGKVDWYKVGKPGYALLHNRIRHIYEDRDHDLWVATDGSIARFDPSARRFVPYQLVDSTYNLNSNWAYSIYHDSAGHIWVATCLGGIMMVDKKELLRHPEKPCVAQRTYTRSNGLGGMFVSQMVADAQGDLWALLYNVENPIVRIDSRTGHVEAVSHLPLSPTRYPQYLLASSDGALWIGYAGGVMRVAGDAVHDVSLQGEVLAMAEGAGKLWVSTTDGFWAVDLQQPMAQRLLPSGRRFTTLYFDTAAGLLYMGMNDEIAVARPDILLGYEPSHHLLLTGLYINNEWTPTHQGHSIRHINKITLPAHANNLSLLVSDLPYTHDEKCKWAYRMEGCEERWNELPAGSNRINYNNLPYGQSVLVVKRMDEEQLAGPAGTVETPLVLCIDILPPWYLTGWAKFIYYTLLVGLVVWVANFVRMKHLLRVARREKEQVMEQLHARMELYSQLSADLRKPVDKIVASVDRLQPLLRDEAATEQLGHVQQSTEQLGTVIEERLDVPMQLGMAQRVPLYTPEAMPVEGESYDEKFMASINALIEEHLSDFELNVNALSEWAGVNQKQLYRKLKQLTGMTPVEYIKATRMKTAAMLLSQQKFTVAEVMYMVGFSSHSYFSKCFQTEYGVTPKSYAKKENG